MPVGGFAKRYRWSRTITIIRRARRPRRAACTAAGWIKGVVGCGRVTCYFVGRDDPARRLLGGRVAERHRWLRTGMVFLRRGGRPCPPQPKVVDAQGADRVVRPYERWPLPFTIQPARAGTVTGPRVAGASDTPRGTSGLWSQCPWGSRRPLRWITMPFYHPSNLFGFRYLAAGDS